MGKTEAQVEIPVEDSKLDAVVESMPPVNPDIEREDKKPEIDYSAVTDKHGRKFDPELHEVDDEGKPRINKKDGKFLTCKPGRPGNPGTKKNQAAEVRTDTRKVDESIGRRVSAEAAVDSFIQVGMMIFGKEWAPVKNDSFDERDNLVQVTDRYFEVKGVKDIPPGAALSIALVAYVAARMRFPDTSSRMRIIFGGIKNSVFGFFSGIFKFFKRFKGIRNGSLINPGNHGIGKDNAGAQTGSEVPEKENSGLGAGPVPVN